MRIIAGAFKGRRIAGPPIAGVRPTSDSLRETLFNVLGPSLDGARVLDAFAGTGALGLEALSRGAAHATFVERDRAMLGVLASNIAACRVASSAAVVRGEFAAVAAGGRLTAAAFDLVLLDPPYDVGNLDDVLDAAGRLVAPDGRLVLEHSRRRAAPDAAGALGRRRLLTAGDSALSFYAVVVSGSSRDHA
jgi:16S rRNA (guanine(966)-N(2))-methyltransferase RsmD